MKDKQKAASMRQGESKPGYTESTKGVARGQSRENKEGLTRGKSTQLLEVRNRRGTQEEQG